MPSAVIDAKSPAAAGTSPTALPALRLLVLARIACEEGASKVELAREIGPLADAEGAAPLAAEGEIVRLLMAGQAIELAGRFTASPSGRKLLLGELGLTELPGTWEQLLDTRIVAKALGLERDAAVRVKSLAKPDVLRTEIVIAAFGLKMRGSASATRLRGALALIALERAFGNKIKSELATGTGLNAKVSRVLAGQLLKRPRDAGTDKRLVNLLAAECMGVMKTDVDALRTALIRRWVGAPPEPPRLTGPMAEFLQSRRTAAGTLPPAQALTQPLTPQPAAAAAQRPPAASRPDLPGFVAIVKKLAGGIAEGWPGNRKALVSRVYNAVEAAHPGWGLSLIEFKAMLAECHRIGQLALSTADLKDKRLLEELRLSAISYKNTVWHQIRVED